MSLFILISMSIRNYADTLIDFQAFLDFVSIITDSHNNLYLVL